MAKRIEWLDSIKGFSIFFVVYCHYVMLPENTFLGNVLMALATCAVPCFMMVTGAIMHSSHSFDWKKYFKRLATIYFVMFLWKIIYLVISFVILDVSFSKVELMKYLFLFGKIANVPSEVMWYMVALILVTLFYPISYFLLKDENSKGKAYIFLLLLAFLSGFGVTFANYALTLISSKFGITLFDINILYDALPFRKHSNMLFFFLLGGILFKNDDRIKQKLKSIKFGNILPFALAAVGIGGLLLTKFIAADTFLWKNISIENGYQRISAILLAVGIWLSFSMYSNKISSFLARYVGKYTMGVYYLHYIILYVCMLYIKPRIPEYIFGMNFAQTVLTICLSILITRIMLKIPIVRILVK